MPRFQVPPLSERKRNKELSYSNTNTRKRKKEKTVGIGVYGSPKKETIQESEAITNSTTNCKSDSVIGESQGTKAIQLSMKKLHTSLTCSICEGIFQEPIATLASCTHSFCYDCIFTHLAAPNNHTTCPICGFSVGVVGAQKVLQINPQLQSVVSSYQRLQHLVQHQLPPFWWQNLKKQEQRPTTTTSIQENTSFSYPSDEEVSKTDQDSTSISIVLPTTQSTYETALEGMVRFPYNLSSISKEESFALNNSCTSNNIHSNYENTQLSQSTYDTAAESILRSNKTLQTSITISTAASKPVSVVTTTNTTNDDGDHHFISSQATKENFFSLPYENADSSTMIRRRRTQSYGGRWKQIKQHSDNPTDIDEYISPTAAAITSNNTEREHSSVETKKTGHPSTNNQVNTPCSPYHFTTPNNNQHNPNVSCDIPCHFSHPTQATMSSSGNNFKAATPVTTPPVVSSDHYNTTNNTSNNNSHIEKLDNSDTTTIVIQDSMGLGSKGAVATPSATDMYARTPPTTSSTADSRSSVGLSTNHNTVHEDLLLRNAKDQKLQYMCYGLTKEQIRSINTCARKGMLSLSQVHLIDCLHDVSKDKSSSYFNLLPINDEENFMKKPLEISKSIPLAQALFSTVIPCISVCGVSEISTCDGDLVKKTFGYILSVAAGLPTVAPSWIAACATEKQWMPFTVDKASKPDWCKRERRRNVSNRSSEGKAFGILGCTNASNGWMVPMKAQQARNIRLSQGKVGCGLLEGYTVLMCGEFDKQQQDNNKNKSKNSLPSWNCYTKERVVALLELCGAKAFDLVSEAAKCLSNEDDTIKSWFRQQGHTKCSKVRPIVVMIRKAATVQDIETTEKYIQWLHGASRTSEECFIPPIVKVNWLIESIADFEVKPYE